MDKLTRLYKLHQTLLAHRHPVPMRAIQDRLECSRATAARAIEEIGPGLLADQLKPFSDRMRKLLADQGIALDARLRRIVFGSVFRRPLNDRFFGTVTAATLRRRKLNIRYHNRSDDRVGDRVVSPQRLVWSGIAIPGTAKPGAMPARTCAPSRSTE